ncbi:hypothetical protein FHS44_008063 [Streptosporangium saharense]|uniref:Uncharacterized protein n=1 Tax=Streptosporangium saharense TaxID=1706840 RepID=A0A7W7VSZ2_9ACTN|nr:hypothetical protein [Streptosporangium saharense]
MLVDELAVAVVSLVRAASSSARAVAAGPVPGGGVALVLVDELAVAVVSLVRAASSSARAVAAGPVPAGDGEGLTLAVVLPAATLARAATASARVAARPRWVCW